MKKNWLFMVVTAMLSLVLITGCGTMDNNDKINDDNIPGEAPLNPNGEDVNPNTDMNDPGNDLQREDNTNTDLNDPTNDPNNNNMNKDGMNNDVDTNNP